MSTAREAYRERTAYGFEGALRDLGRAYVHECLQAFMRKVDQGVERALELGNGVFPTYFYYEVTKHEVLTDEQGLPKRNEKGQQLVRALEFRRVDLPYFLEGPTRAMKILPTRDEKRQLYEGLKQTGIYDAKLKMYKVNASLAGQPNEIGRARAFTPGWLENESVFLHMAYKYLLELLKAGLYEPFFEEMQRAMVPFFDPQVYGRSILENSSFIASSANPDESLHGTGFVARLSGSTAEFLSMWNWMMWGPAPFQWEKGELLLRFRPALPSFLFDSANHIRATFLGSCQVTYYNPERAPTYGEKAALIKEMSVHFRKGGAELIQGDTLPSAIAKAVRNHEVNRIDVKLVQSV